MNHKFVLFDLLTNVEERFQKEDLLNPEIQSLLEYTTKLKEEIPTLSKKVLKSRAINILVKARKLGLKFLKDVIETGYKEGIKYALKLGGHNLIDVIQHHIN